jgi:glyoxylase-like metal-dependent hydrolase (beta-lactamase superfamily II)
MLDAVLTPALTRITDTLFAARIPIPYPMKFVTVLIDRADPVTLVDTAIDTPEARAALQAALTELELTWQDIERVIVTHHHPDHYGLAGWIQTSSGADVLMLDIDIERGAAFWNRWEDWMGSHTAHYLRHGLPKDQEANLWAESRTTRSRIHPARPRALTAGDRLDLGGLEWEVLWLPGHADGHLGLWNAQEALLIAGDVILERITPNIGLWANTRPDPLGDYLETLERVTALNPHRAVIGHYGPILEDVPERAQEIKAHHHVRLELCRRLERPMNAFEASWLLFPQELNNTGRRFAQAETLAHLEYLRWRGDLRSAEDDGIVRFWRA